MFSDLSDVFLIVYLKGKIPAEDMPLTNKTESFADALERENKRNPGDENKQEDGVLE